MGAWGEGMQSNDTALDAIGSAGLSCGEPRKQKKTLADLRAGKKTVKSLFSGGVVYGERNWIRKEPQAILGLVEYLLEEGFDLKPVGALVRKALRNQLSKTELGCWQDSNARKAALMRFKDRLNGKKVPQELIDQDNEGLFSKMAKTLG
jgi:hypothetical protein